MSRLTTFRFGIPTTDTDSTFYSNTSGNISTGILESSQDSSGRFMVNNVFFGKAQVFSQNGVKDATWTTNTNAWGYVGGSGCYLNSNGDAYLYDANYGGFAKVTPTGTLDGTWTILSWSMRTTPGAMKVQADGKLLLTAGTLGVVNGVSFPGIVRLNADGTPDTAFATNLGTGASGGGVIDVGIQSDGKIVIVGDFSSWNGNTRTGIVRLNTDGTEDGVFYSNIGGITNPNSPPRLKGVKIQSDDKVIAAGALTAVNSVPCYSIFRLNSDGTPDNAYNANIGLSTATSGTSIGGFDVQSTGKVVLYGGFNQWNLTAPKCVARLNADGTMDYSFFSALGVGVDQGNYGSFYPNVGVLVQPDDKIVFLGQFTVMNTVSRSAICRVGVDGGTPSSFVVPAGVTKMFAQAVTSAGVPLGPAIPIDVVPGTTLYRTNTTGTSYSQGYIGDEYVTTLSTSSQAILTYGGGNSTTTTFQLGWVE